MIISLMISIINVFQKRHKIISGYLLLIVVFSSCSNYSKEYSVKKLTQEPLIDGALDQCWELIERTSVNNEVKGKLMWKGDSDLSAYFRCAWLNNNLYFYIEVTDDICRSYSDSLVSYWESDNVELFFSVKNKKAAIEKMSIHDSIFQFSFVYDKNKVFQALTLKDPIQICFAQAKIKSGYTFEIKIPFINRVIDNHSNKIGFNIEILDNDNDSYDEGFVKGIETKIGWSPGSTGKSWQETINYGELLIQ